jgi:membrane fusion protein (multidrug efflux system)
MDTVRSAVFLVAVAVGTAACGGSGGGGPPGGGGRGPSGPRAVVTARPEAVAWQRTVELGGTLEAPERVEIAARIEGAVVSLDAELGDRVTRGQVLARITPEDFAARVAQNDAERDQAQAELERAQRLAERDLASREQIEQAETRVRVLGAQRRLAARQLRDTRIVAPFDGAIASRLASPGAFVRVGTPLFVLVATDPLRLVLDVPEAYAGEVQAGSRVLVTGAEEATLSVTRVSPVVDPATRTFRAHIDVPSSAGLVAGRYLRARIELGTVPDAVRVPRSAVFEVLGRSRVVEVVEGRATPRDVELIAEEDGRAIVRGLAAGVEVVSRSPGLLAPGTEVRTEADAPEGAAASAGEREGPRRGS